MNKPIPSNPFNDPFAREFKSLRVSLTQFCDFSCVYCVPDGSTFKRLPEELSADEFYKIILALHRFLGLEKIRITGGEPLLYRQFDKFIKSLGVFSELDLSITTNGSHMEAKAQMLWDNGFRRVNFSMDSVNSTGFARMSRNGSLARTLKGLDKCIALGFKIKINMVPMQTYNVGEILDMLKFCLERGIELRYIELMRMGHVKDFFDAEYVSKQYILDTIATEFEFRPTKTPPDSTALVYDIPAHGTFGIIANESSPFCKGCNRLRLTSNGQIYGCISTITSFDARQILDTTETETKKILQSIMVGAMQTKQTNGFIGAPTYMKHIGG